MNKGSTQWLVITDLDATLLNHHDYSIEAALPVIEMLKEKQIPIIFNTSKTWSETLSIRQSLGIEGPFIVENGSAIFLPKVVFSHAPPSAVSRDDDWQVTLGEPVQSIRTVLNKIDTPPGYYTCLSDCTIEEAIKLTGLSPEQSRQAISREFSEPLIWHEDEKSLATFKQQLSASKLTTLKGGRFLHVLGECDKGMAATLLKQYYSMPVKTIVLGDSPNDADMLSMADISIIVNSPSSEELNALVQADIKTSAVAPEGWAEGVTEALVKAEAI